jgi:hypothetical protein
LNEELKCGWRKDEGRGEAEVELFVIGVASEVISIDSTRACLCGAEAETVFL